MVIQQTKRISFREFIINSIWHMIDELTTFIPAMIMIALLISQ